MKQYANYHKHDIISNIFVPDTHVKCESYLKRIKELGYDCYWTTNHGSGGDIFEARDLCDKYGIKCFFGVEGYIVPNPLDKDNRNYHIIIIPKTNEARKKVNYITSHASEEGFYYKPRIFLEDLLKLNKEDIYLTSACVAGLMHDEDSIELLLKPLVEHFGQNFFLEVQNHQDELQKEINRKCLQFSKQYGLKLIAANDSHYIYPEDSKDRLEFLKGKGIDYGDEDTYVLDYPDYDTMFSRFQKQGILTDKEIEEAIDNTRIFETCEEIYLDKEIKMPSAYLNLNPDEKIKELKKHINKKFAEIREEEHIEGEQLKKYIEGIRQEMQIIIDTKEINTADYFLLNEKIVDLAVHKYNGVLTRTGRGSCGGFYINRILGMTQIDRFTSPIKLYPERFISTARLLENRAMPDIDYNVASQEPFVLASREVLGEHSVYPMIAYGTMQIGEAFRNVCRSHGLEFDEFNDVAKDIDNYSEDPKWKPYIEEAKKYVDVVVSASVHPCFCGDELVYTDKGYIKIKDLAKGNRVLSHDGCFHSVLNTMITKNRPIVELKIDGQCIIKVTENHPLLVKHKTSHTGSYKRLTSAKWKQVSDLIKDDYVFIPINNNAIIPEFNNIVFSNEFLWIVGRWLGDGWLKKRYDNRTGEYIINICCNKNESKEIKDVLDKTNYNYWIDNERTTDRFNIQDKNLYMFLECFGKGAGNKFIPQFIIDLPKELLKCFVEGYLSADGYEVSKNRFSFTTISKSLALGMQNCINKVFNVYCHLTSCKRKDNYLEGRLLKGNVQYVGQFTINSRRKDYVLDDNGVWVRFVSFELLNEKSDVYNIEVSDTHTYTVNNIVCHNCAHAMDNKDLRYEYGIVKIGNALCVMITSGEADYWKILKDDFLIVSIWGIIADTFKLIGKPIITVNQLLNDLDDRVWDLYANGITCTLNQVDSDYATSLMKKYKARSVGELAQFTAAVRPSFDAWRDAFIYRKPFTTGSKYLDDVLSETRGMITFQETLMTYFQWLGITPAESIGLIKKISKKKIHPEDFKNLEDRLKEQWIKNTGSIDKFDDTWKMVQGCMSYGFAAPHALATAIDSLYGAWLKVHYPLEYYSVVFKYYEGDMERTNKLTEELKYFNISLKNIQFGHSAGSYKINKEENSIYKGLGSIKYCNVEVGDKLYELSQSKQYNSFVEILKDFPGDSRQLDILIKLGYFSDFGSIGKLLKIVEVYNQYGSKTIIKKDQCVIDRDIMLQYATETEKQYRLKDKDGFINYLLGNITYKEYPIAQRIKDEKEYLGYISLKIEGKSSTWYVTDINTKYSPKVSLYNVGTGEEKVVKIEKRKYQMAPFDKDVCLRATFEEKNKCKKDENGDWVKLEEKEEWIKYYSVV